MVLPVDTSCNVRLLSPQELLINESSGNVTSPLLASERAPHTPHMSVQCDHNRRVAPPHTTAWLSSKQMHIIALGQVRGAAMCLAGAVCDDGPA